MSDDISLYDYDLPRDLIAQSPASPRETARLMILNRRKKTISHKSVWSLPDYFRPGDLVVINNTKVFKARLFGVIRNPNAAKIELLLLRPLSEKIWHALVKPGKKCPPGTVIDIAEGMSAVIDKILPDGSVYILASETTDGFIRLADRFGHVPSPPYVKKEPLLADYQTSYAKITGSVAAPTAGFHLTPEIRRQITGKGAGITEITLHVGLGTFRPVKTKNISDHRMHPEWVSVSRQAAEKINLAKKENRRIIAVGTTTVRTIEGVAAINCGIIKPHTGDINLFIKPGFKFRIIDGMLTNFHLPKSTLIVLVSTFAGHGLMMDAYGEAVKQKYRFYSFGDAMLII